uniref:RpiB/LacA/LacB family sugar-phosphate isomerase n=1 Tax=candidate division WOR-3 bacterium TaxID=2052148 RepID=A0A7C4THY3_UNCW3
MKIAIGADHRGYRLIKKIREYLESNSFVVFDYGTDSADPVDYPLIAFQVAMAVKKKKARFGIVSCFSGQGMAITANKVKGIRAAICTDKEGAYYARAHNDANILVLPARSIKNKNQWRPILETFFTTEFEGGRHRRRLNIIKNYEKRKSFK